MFFANGFKQMYYITYVFTMAGLADSNGKLECSSGVEE